MAVPEPERQGAHTRIANMLEDRLTASGLVLSKSFLSRLAGEVLVIAQQDQDSRRTLRDEVLEEAGGNIDPSYTPPGLHGEGWQTRADLHDATSVTDIFEHPAAGPVYASGGYISQSQVYDKAMNGPNVPDPPLKPGEVRAWKNQDDELLREILEAFPDAEVVGIGVRGKSAYSWWLVLRGRGDT